MPRQFGAGETVVLTAHTILQKEYGFPPSCTGHLFHTYTPSRKAWRSGACRSGFSPTGVLAKDLRKGHLAVGDPVGLHCRVMQ
jgi:hypothetical protein